MTPLDTAHAAMQADPDSGTARLRFYDRLAESELFLMLTGDPEGDRISPDVFAIDAGQFVLAFDLEERLAAFAGRIAPYAALSGRNIVALLAPQGLGLALNPDVAPSTYLVPPDAVQWLHDMLAHRPETVTLRPRELSAPRDLPELLLSALDAKLATAAGLARLAYLAAVTWDNGARGHMLAFVDCRPGAEDALAQAVGEALTFSGIEAGTLDVAFFAATDPVAARLARVALRFDLPEPEAAAAPDAPGMDPDRPPRLR